MRRILQLISACALVATILPSVLFLAERMEVDQVKWYMLLATIGWFVVTPIWMGRHQELNEESVAA